MTTLMTSFIAIVLFGMITLATITYGDALGMMGVPDAIDVAQRLQSGAEVVAQAEREAGSRPTSLAELEAAGLPEGLVDIGASWEMACVDERCSPLSLCLSFPESSSTLSLVDAAAERVSARRLATAASNTPGRAYASGTCGVEGTSGTGHAVVTLNL